LDRHLLNRFAEGVRGRGRSADVGCGPGHVARYLRDQGVEVVGIDLSPEMVRRAQQLNPGIEFRVGDLRALDLADGALAGMASFSPLIHLEEPEIGPALRELRRVLTPGGLALVAFDVGEETLHKDELWGHAISLDFRFLLPARVTAQLAEAGFRLLES